MAAGGHTVFSAIYNMAAPMGLMMADTGSKQCPKLSNVLSEVHIFTRKPSEKVQKMDYENDVCKACQTHVT